MKPWAFTLLIEGGRIAKGIRQKIDGIVKDDTNSLKSCAEFEEVCAYSRAFITEEQAKKVYEFIQNQNGLTGKTYHLFESLFPYHKRSIFLSWLTVQCSLLTVLIKNHLIFFGNL